MASLPPSMKTGVKARMKTGVKISMKMGRGRKVLVLSYPLLPEIKKDRALPM